MTTKTRDPITRLRAANPADAGAPLTADEEQAARALVEQILGTSPQAEAPSGHTAPRSRRIVPAAVVGAGVAAAAALLIASLGGSENAGILGKAYGAISHHDAIYHVVLVSDIRSNPTLTGHPARRERTFQEGWFTGNGTAAHALVYGSRRDRRGALEQEIASSGARSLAFFAKANAVVSRGAPPARSYDPLAMFREFYRGGHIRSDKQIVFAGRRAHRIVAEDVGTRTTLVVDARTYLPLEERIDFTDNTRLATSVVTRYTTFERRARTPATDALLLMRPHPRARHTPVSGLSRADTG
jgi:hypothetical protein